MKEKNLKGNIFWGTMFLSGLLSALLLVILYHKMTDISRPFPSFAPQSSSSTESLKPAFRIGVVSRFPPTFIYKGYQPVMDYLTLNTPYRFELQLSKSYKQTVEQLVSGEVVAAFLGSFIFAREAQNHRLRCILRPLSAGGRPMLQAVVICKADIGLHSIADLKGKRVALPSALSFSSNWFLNRALYENGFTQSQLDSVHHFAHHHTVVYEVLKGNFDAGVVKDRVANEFRNRGIRVFARSEPIPSSPMVISDQSPQAVVQAIQTALLKIDARQPRYQKMLSEWDAEFAYGFAPARNEDYDVLLPLVNKREAP
ncbi:PhnD/SsuA/transferrin family substrate-binding protein [Caldithrix abyssi]